MTPDELRQQGYSVKFKHIRRWIVDPPEVFATMGGVGFAGSLVLSPTGGRTACYIAKDGELIAEGEAIVNNLDTYNKKIGRIKAFGRAWGDFQKKLPAE